MIFKAIQRHVDCRLLVFGLGNDTPLWLEMNQNGQTIFLEDNKEWFERMTSLNPQAKAYLVHYSTQRTQWKELLDHPENLQMQLPEPVAQARWDVILVDDPAGYTDENPGRMQSIYTASKLISKGGCVFVHDCHREVEQIYSNKYLLKKNFVPHILINSTLRQYAFK